MQHSPIPPERNKIYEALYRRCRSLEKQIEQLTALREISFAVGRSLEFSEIVTIIAEVVQGALNVPRVILYSYEEDSALLVPLVAKYGNDLITRERLQEDSVPARRKPFQEVLSERRIFLTQSFSGYKAFIPLVIRESTLGIMVLERLSSQEPFSPEEERFYLDIAVPISIALHNARLYQQAVRDGLTQLYVRRYFDVRVAEEFAQAQRYGRVFSVALMDIDHFKKFNDTYGHQTGDAVLRQVARILQTTTRASDICCRYGGEEMALIFPETELRSARVIAEKLRMTIETTTFVGAQGEKLHLTASFGIAAYTPNLSVPDGLVRAADEALYRAKEGGRNRVEMATENARK
jgi:diguanylate cyclase (GGDEF)-like protein